MTTERDLHDFLIFLHIVMQLLMNLAGVKNLINSLLLNSILKSRCGLIIMNVKWLHIISLAPPLHEIRIHLWIRTVDGGQ